VDGLGFLDYAKVLSSAITSAETNLTIGIFGGWGTGKTTLMKLIQNELDQLPQRDIRSLWFNTWQYESEEHPLVPLCESIFRQIEEKRTLDKA
jgi:predicted KAP-like P-loop ATPase